MFIFGDLNIIGKDIWNKYCIDNNDNKEDLNIVDNNNNKYIGIEIEQDDLIKGNIAIQLPKDSHRDIDILLEWKIIRNNNIIIEQNSKKYELK